MCGICGLIQPAGLPPESPIVVREMARRLSHRGPDDEGFYEDTWAALGSRRLSIVDIAGGRQPISSEDGGVQVVYNGEIYNYRELRRSLEAAGHRFKTATDTEVIVHAYEEHGPRAVRDFNGIFALALWDSRRRRLLLARDPMGVKPLYYAWVGGALAFASEAKALFALPNLSRKVDPEALELYLAFRFVPSPWTLFQGIRKLRPGESLILEPDRPTRTEHYPVPPSEPDGRPSEEEWIEGFVHELRLAVRRQMMGDVPVGVLLSGGIDSASVLALAVEDRQAPVRAYTVGFAGSPDLDETGLAASTARTFRVEHRHETLSSEAYREHLAPSLFHLDEPVATTSVAPFDLLCQLASRENKVVLSGQGADEPFGGYQRHLGEKIASHPLGRFLAGPVSFAARAYPRSERLERAFRALRTRDPVQRYAETLALFPGDELRALLVEPVAGPAPEEVLRPLVRQAESLDPLGRFLYLDARFGLPDDLLLYTDKIAMASSLEVRVPYLDLELLRFVERIPSSLRVRLLDTKHFLKRAFGKILPGEVLRRPKRNFSPPVSAWMTPAAGEPSTQWLLEPGSAVSRYLRPEKVASLLEEQRLGRHDRRRQIFALLAFEVWHRTFIDREEPAPLRITHPRQAPSAPVREESRASAEPLRVVTHFGPGPDGPGGMSSVLRNYAAFPLQRHRFQFVTTYHPHYRLWSLRPFLQALWLLSTRPTQEIGIAHFHVSARGSFVREGILVGWARKRGVPTCVTIHSGDFPAFLAAHPRTVLSVLSHADRVLVLGNNVRAELERVTGISDTRVLPNAVHLGPPTQAPGECPPHVLFGGNISGEKGVDTLLACWPSVLKAVPESRLLVAGPFSDIQPRPLRGVEWLGPVTSDELLDLLARSRVAVLPSRKEGMPMFVLEAMAQGRPVVATAVGTIPDILADAGTVIPAGDGDALVAGLTTYLLDPARADRAGEEGRERVRKYFTSEQVARALEQVYDSLDDEKVSGDPSSLRQSDYSGGS